MSEHLNIYQATFVDTPTPNTLRTRHDTAVGVDGSGKIVFVESTSSSTAAEQAARYGWTDPNAITVHRLSPNEACTRFFFPGLIDTHTHASQYPNVGIFGSTTLLQWLETYTFPLESSFENIDRARKVYSRVVRRSLSHGTTAVAYYATVHVPATNLLADTCLNMGQRALIGRVCMDRLSPDYYRDESPEDSIEKTKAVIAHVESIDPRGDIVRPVITPRFAPSCTNASLEGLGKLHKETGHMVQTHISENLSEIDLVKDMFPDSKHYTGVYDETGLLSDKTILAHAVHLSTEEIQLVKDRGAKISHCPVSNSCLASGASPVKQLMLQGVDVSLGTDMSGGFSPSILEACRHAILVSRHRDVGDQLEAAKGTSKASKSPDNDQKLSVTEALWLATAGGAKAMGLDEKVGAFEPGREFDGILVEIPHVSDAEELLLSTNNISDIGPIDMFGWEQWDDRIAKWVYGGDDRNIRAVYVKGKRVHSIER